MPEFTGFRTFKNLKSGDQRDPAIDLYLASLQAKMIEETEELEAWLMEAVALADFDRIDDIFIAEYPDGTRAVQSWWNKPDYI